MHKENEKENKKIKVEFVLDKSSGLYNSVIIKPENKEESWEEELIFEVMEDYITKAEWKYRLIKDGEYEKDMQHHFGKLKTFIKDLISKTEDRVRKEIIENK